MQLLEKFKKYLEKQDVLNKIVSGSKLDGFGYSQMHVIATIGDIESPNVTEISKRLNLTRGAVSKITQKLLNQNLIETYMQPKNKQKIFFKLTESGEKIYAEHKKLHESWIERDSKFLEKFSQDELSLIADFMDEYNNYLDEQIKEMKGDSKC